MNIIKELKSFFNNNKEYEQVKVIAICKQCRKPITEKQGYMVRGYKPVAIYTHIECGMNTRKGEELEQYG